MNKENVNNASDKLYIIDDKIEFIANMVMYVNLDIYHFTKTDLVGLGMILRSLQEEIKEVKNLLK